MWTVFIERVTRNSGTDTIDPAHKKSSIKIKN